MAVARTDPKRLLVKLIVIGTTIVGAALVLWTAQTAEALLRVSSFPAAMVEILFWGLPGMLAYLLLCRRWPGIAVGGGLLAGLTLLEWSQVATDTHSTASLGPAFVGWIEIPALLVIGAIGSRIFHQSRGTTELEHQ
jgi:hypothetical protein